MKGLKDYLLLNETEFYDKDTSLKVPSTKSRNISRLRIGLPIPVIIFIASCTSHAAMTAGVAAGLPVSVSTPHAFSAAEGPQIALSPLSPGKMVIN